MLSDFNASEQDAITGAIRARFTEMTPGFVAGVIGADPEHADAIWSPTRVVSASVRSTRDLADRSLEAGSWGAEYVTGTDDTASGDYAMLAQGYQTALADREMSDEDSARMKRLEADFRVSMNDFVAAKQKVAKVVSGVSSAVIGAVITAATAGTGAPIAAALVTTALSGMASIAIHEGILRDDHDAEQAMAELGVELLKTAVTAHMSKFWTAGQASVGTALTQSVRGRQLLAAQGMLQRAGTATFGKFGVSMASTALDTATGDISDVAWKMLDPSMYQYGFDQAMADGLTELEGAVRGMPTSVLQAMLAECAKQAGQAAVKDDASSTPTAQSLGANLPDAPDPETEPKAFLEYLKAALAKVPESMWDEAVKSGVTGLANNAVTEGTEYLLTGDENVDIDRTLGVFAATGIAVLKHGGSEALGTVGTARSQRAAAVASHARAPEHQARMAQVATIDHDLSETEFQLFREWSRDNGFDPVGGDLLALPTEQGETDAQVVRAQAEQDLRTFRTVILAPIEATLARQESTWGADHSEAEREQYRAWVLSGPAGIDARAAVTPTDYLRRRDAAGEAISKQREGEGYASLNPQARLWFEHAARHPTALVDLTKDSADVAIRVQTEAEARAFTASLPGLQEQVATAVLADVSPDLPKDVRTWAATNAQSITAGLSMSPSDQAANRRLVMARAVRAHQASLDASILERVSAP
jgi:hypothetical protein